jgi:hypothetical protein
MATQQIEYRKVRPKNDDAELRMIAELRKMGKPFRAVSRTEYIVSKQQCDVLKRKNVPYDIVV